MPITFDRETIENHPFFKDGLKEGLQKGLEKGKLEGLKEGLERAKREDVIKLHKKLNMSVKEIAEVLELPLDFVEEVLKKA